MKSGHALVIQRSIYIWIGTFALIGFNLFAATQRSLALTYIGLLATGVFAIVGIAFGIWAGKTVSKRV